MRIRNALTPASRSTANGLATGADGEMRKGRAVSVKSWLMSTPCQVSSLRAVAAVRRAITIILPMPLCFGLGRAAVESRRPRERRRKATSRSLCGEEPHPLARDASLRRDAVLRRAGRRPSTSRRHVLSRLSSPLKCEARRPSTHVRQRRSRRRMQFKPKMQGQRQGLGPIPATLVSCASTGALVERIFDSSSTRSGTARSRRKAEGCVWHRS
mmetsp:Transcript_15634/g.48461  ORF Transcript_15634/g.48461 Transcript_15634/m.48461 type:complete len:213 (-) Transcript_15634:223-861(-)